MTTRITAIAITLLIAGTMLMSCESATRKEQAAAAKVEEAQKELQEAQQNAVLAAQRTADAEEWRIFKADVEEKIVKNENRIAELKVQLKKPGKALDEVYAKKIDALEQQNKNLRERMLTYEKNQSDWDSFKREFNNDMDALAKALNNLVTDNKN
jgi:chromosome segregation ATPase